MSIGWEPDDIVAIVDELSASFGAPALHAIDRALARTARAFGESLHRSDAAPLSPGALLAHFVGNPSEHCEIIEESPTTATLRTTSCRLAEAFRDLGRPEVGFRFKCAQDFEIAHGYNDRIRLSIRRSLMNGDDCCLHEYRMDPDAPERESTA